jgi:hypothetical protein
MGRVARLILNYVGEKIFIYEKLVKQATIGNTILSHHRKIKFHSHLNLHLQLIVAENIDLIEFVWHELELKYLTFSHLKYMNLSLNYLTKSTCKKVRKVGKRNILFSYLLILAYL